MNHDTIPERESLLEALRLIGRTADGQPLALGDDEQLLANQALLVGMLDAAVDALAQQMCSGKGKSRRLQVVLGYKRYLAASEPDRDLMEFFQSKLARLAGDMKTAMNEKGL